MVKVLCKVVSARLVEEKKEYSEYQMNCLYLYCVHLQTFSRPSTRAACPLSDAIFALLLFIGVRGIKFENPQQNWVLGENLLGTRKGFVCSFPFVYRFVVCSPPTPTVTAICRVTVNVALLPLQPTYLPPGCRGRPFKAQDWGTDTSVHRSKL